MLAGRTSTVRHVEKGDELKRVLVLGATGMLGHMVLDYLRKQPDIEVIGTQRPESNIDIGTPYRLFEAGDRLGLMLNKVDYVVNCIGVTKPFIQEGVPLSVERAIKVNSLFPCELAGYVKDDGPRVINIATDCVFSGQKGEYHEKSPHDATDVYGKTKSLGEVNSPNMHYLRTSIIGPELAPSRFLLEWLRGQGPNAEVKGFDNHWWNGITTLAFARLCYGIIKKDIPLLSMKHIIPADFVNKYELLCNIAAAYGRGDIKIEKAEAPLCVDRTLSTLNIDLNDKLWNAAGYDEAPEISAMIDEMAVYGR